MKISELLESFKRSKDKESVLDRIKVWSRMKVRRIFGYKRNMNNTVEMGTLTEVMLDQSREEEICQLKENLEKSEKKIQIYKEQVDKDIEFYKAQSKSHLDDSTENSILNVIDELINTLERSCLLNESFFEIETVKFEQIFQIIEELHVTLDCEMEERGNRFILDLMEATKLNQSDKIIQDAANVFFEARKTFDKCFWYRLQDIIESLHTQRSKMDTTERNICLGVQGILMTLRSIRGKTSRLLNEKTLTYERIFENASGI